MAVRKRRWIKEYRCEKYGVNVLGRVSFCKEECRDKKCRGCEWREQEQEEKDKGEV